MNHKLKEFKNNKQGFVITSIVVISFLVLSCIIWAVGALVIMRFYDGIEPLIATLDPQVEITSQAALTAYSGCIVVVIVCFLVYWGISTQKKESYEQPGGIYF